MLQRSTHSEGLFRRAQQTGPFSQVWPQLVKHLAVPFARTRVLLEAAPSPEFTQAFGANPTMSHSAGRLIATLHGLADEATPPVGTPTSTAADVDVTAEEIDADNAGELGSNAAAASDGDEEVPFLPDPETSARLLPVDPEDVVVARRPRRRSASLLSG